MSDFQKKTAISGIYHEESFPTSRAFLKTPDHQFINFRDIAASLSKQCMFNGNTHTFYSVAQFSILIADIIYDHFDRDPEDQLLGILNFAHFKYVGYQSENMQMDFGHEIRTKILQHAGFPEKDIKFTLQTEQAILRAYATAKRDVLPEHNYPDMTPANPYRHPIQVISPEQAEERYLVKLTRLITQSGYNLPDELAEMV